MDRSTQNFGTLNFVIRWIGALLLVGLIFNPAGYSYFHWIRSGGEQMLPLKMLAGIALLIAVLIYLRATFRSIGWIGITLTLGFLGALVWLLVDLRWLNLGSSGAVGWLTVVICATVLAVGMSWSHIRRRISGQLDTDDTDD